MAQLVRMFRSPYICTLVLLSAACVAEIKPAAVLPLQRDAGEVTCIGFTSDSQFLFAGSLDSYASVWKAPEWRITAEISPAPAPKSPPGEHEDEFRYLNACASQPLKDEVLFASGGDSLAIYALPKGAKVADHHFNVNDRALSVSTDGLEVALGDGKVVTLFSADDWRKRGSLAISGTVGTVSYSPKSGLLAVAIADQGGIQIWETAKMSLVRNLTTTGNWQQMSFSPDGRLLAATLWGSGQRTGVHVWRVESGERVAELVLNEGNVRHKNDVWAVSFSPDGKLLVSGDTNGNLTLWKVGDWQQCLRFAQGSLYQVAISPDARWLAAGGGGVDVSIWDFQDLVKNCNSQPASNDHLR
jgi:WD40 repeat protein